MYGKGKGTGKKKQLLIYWNQDVQRGQKMKEKTVRPRSRTFRGYIISYIGVVLIALALLSIMAARQIAVRMREEGIRVTQSKLYTVVEDLEGQFSSMRTTALEIASAKDFSPAYFMENKYREIELLERLKKYRSNGAIAEFFFLKFPENENIFTAAGTTMPLGLYLEDHLNAEEKERAAALIHDLCADVNQPYFLYKAEGAPALFCYPLEKYAMNGKKEGVLCFEVTEKGLRARMEKVAGELEGSMALYYDGTLIYGKEQTGEALQRESNDGKLKVFFWPETESYFSWSNVFSAGEWIIFTGIAIVLLGVAVLAAWRSYRPIRDIARKYGSVSDKDSAWELEGIDLLIETLLRRDEKNNMLLQQYQDFREQTIRLIAQGGCSEGIRERLPMLNLHLDMAVFCRMTCLLHTPVESEEDSRRLCADVEELSDDGVWLYPYWGERGELNVLAALSEEYQAGDAAEALQDLLEARGIAAQVTRTAVCHDLLQLGPNLEWTGRQSGFDSLVNEEESGSGRIADIEEGAQGAQEDTGEDEAMQENPSMPAYENGAPRESGKKSSTVIQAMEYIEKNCTNYDLSLDRVAQEFHITSAYLCRLIKQQTGVNYKEYLTGLRIAAAKEMLKDKNASVSDVCQRTGYTNVSHFIKIFQKAEGVTPAKYRNEYTE